MLQECAKCDWADSYRKEPKAHDCPHNYEGSSKGMESMATLRLVVKAFEEQGVVVGMIMADNDSSMKTIVHHSYKLLKAKPKEKGELYDYPT